MELDADDRPVGIGGRGLQTDGDRGRVRPAAGRCGQGDGGRRVRRAGTTQRDTCSRPLGIGRPELQRGGPLPLRFRFE